MINGYIMVKAHWHPAAVDGYVYEHRLVAEAKLGRLLQGEECVHHINHIKTDNRPGNVMVCKTNAEHIAIHASEHRAMGRPLPMNTPAAIAKRAKSKKDNALLRAAGLLMLCACLIAGEWVETTAVLTAFCPCTYCCGHRAQGITADGTDVRKEPYGIAADPQRLPFGTWVYIPLGEGYLDRQQTEDRVFRVDDTGGIVRRRTRRTGIIHLDLRFIHHSSAVRFGIKTATVWVWYP